jgi:hypothetical protein
LEGRKVEERRITIKNEGVKIGDDFCSSFADASALLLNRFLHIILVSDLGLIRDSESTTASLPSLMSRLLHCPDSFAFFPR